MSKNRPYVIYAPLYRDTVGGSIALHKLGALLSEFDQDVFIWPFDKPGPGCIKVKNHARWMWKQLDWKLTSRSINSPYNLKISGEKDLRDAIVIYPEVINDNPLHAARVVRWFLHKPGFFKGTPAYGLNDLCFYYQPQFQVPEFNCKAQLFAIELMLDIYKQTNFGSRSGACFMVRKGLGCVLDQHPAGARQVDGLGHVEMAEVFNSCEYFISYDSYTLYSRYAAMCGCVSIVVPSKGISKDEWKPQIEGRYGIAYGWDDVEWAVETRRDLARHLKDMELLSKKTVREFIDISQRTFAPRNWTEA